MAHLAVSDLPAETLMPPLGEGLLPHEFLARAHRDGEDRVISEGRQPEIRISEVTTMVDAHIQLSDVGVVLSRQGRSL